MPLHPAPSGPAPGGGGFGGAPAEGPPVVAKRASSRAVEVIPRPVWSSFAVDHMRRFQEAERQYRAQLVASGSQPPSLLELVDVEFLPAVTPWAAGRERKELKAPKDLAASEIPAWDAVVRAAFDKYVGDPALTDCLSVEDIEGRLCAIVHWPRELPTYLEAMTQFQALYNIARDKLRLDATYLVNDKNKRRCVGVLVSQLHPTDWRTDVQNAVQRRAINDPAALFAYLGTREEERAYMAFRAVASPSSGGGASGGSGFSRGRRVSFQIPSGPDAGSSPHGGFTPRPPSSARGVVGRLRAKVWSARGGAGRGAGGANGGDRGRDGPAPSVCWGCGRPGHRLEVCRTVTDPSERSRIRRDRGLSPSAGQRSSSRDSGSRERAPWYQRSRRVLPGVGASSHDGLLHGTSLYFLLDSGCTENFISPAAAAEILALVPGARSEVLPSPIVVGTVAAEGRLEATVRVVGTVRLSFVDGSSWTLPDCNFLVVPGLSDDDVLIGRPCITELPADLVQRVYMAAGTVPSDSVVPTGLSAGQLLRQAAVVDAASAAAVSEEVLAAEDVGGVDVGENDADAVRAVLQRALDNAAAEGLSPGAVERLRAAVMGDLFDCFRLRMCGDPPADVPPVRVQLVPGARPVRHKPRRYSAEDSAYMRETMDTLERLGYVYRNPGAVWSSPAFPVRKANVAPTAPLSERFRMCVDLRGVNRVTEPMAFPLPRLEYIVEQLGGRCYIGSLDINNGFWQLALAPECQEWFTIVTDVACYTPRRLVQGSLNGTAPFYQAMVEALGDLIGVCCVVYVDDIAIYGKDEEEFITNLLRVIVRLHAKGIRVSALKVVFYAAVLRFCGRVFSAAGITLDPAYIRSVAAMPPPVTAAQLSSYIATVNWARLAVPRFAEFVRPLQDLLSSVLKSHPSATKSQRESILLAECGWGPEHSDAFARLNACVVQNTALAYPREGWAISVWFDASDTAWGGVVCQCPPAQLELPPLEQVHEPLAFLSGLFKGAQLNYSVVERECLAFVMVCQKASHLLRRPGGFLACTDHRNLQYLLSPDPTVAASRRQAAARIERWMVYLRSFEYTLVHVPGEQNVAADLLSRWTPSAYEVSTPSSSAQARALTRRQAQQSAPRDSVPDGGSGAAAGSVGRGDDGPAFAGAGAPGGAPVGRVGGVVAVDPPAAASSSQVFATASDVLDFSVRDCPMLEEIVAAQAEAVRRDGVPVHAHLDGDGVYVTATQRVWVPDVQCLRLRLAVVAHQGPAAHRGVDTTLRALQQYFYWDSMASDIATFVSACLFCAQVRGGGRIPRPLGNTITATGPGQEIRFDFAHVRAPSAADGHDYRWILTMQDSFSRYVELTPARSAESGVVVQAILNWYARFGHAKRWITDGGSHFCNEVLSELRRLCNADHHVVVAYSSQSNGQVERVHREVWTGLRAICAESKLNHGCWPQLLPLVAAVWNHSPSTALDGLAPVTVHCGLPPINPVAVVFLPTERDLQPVDVSTVDFKAHVQRLQSQLFETHQRVRDQPGRHRHPQPGEQPVDFGVGSFVLVAQRGDKQRRDKLAVRWRGPARVVDFVGPLVAKVEDLVTGDVSEVHCQHLKAYADADLVVSKQLVSFAAHSCSGYVVRAILDHRLRPVAELLVSWEGYGADEDCWQPLANMLEDVPSAVRLYARTVQDRERRRELLAYLTIVDKAQSST